MLSAEKNPTATPGEPFFTVVVPCCQVERYLPDMIRSLEGQSFADWECVLSYEDSTDETKAVCEARMRQDARFRLVEGPRSGSPATPRNRALAVARGRYVVWIDGDDWLADDALAKVAAHLRAHGEPEALQGSATEMLDDGLGLLTFRARHYNFEAADDGKVLSGLEVTQRVANLPRFAMPMASLTVARRDFLLANGLTFVDGLKYEDNEWTARVLALADRVLVMDGDVYVYRRRKGSVTTTTDVLNEYRQKSEMFWHIFHFFGTHRLSEPFCRAWARKYVSYFFDQIFLDGIREGRKGISALEWTRCLRRILSHGGRRAFLKLSLYAGWPKKVVAPFVVLCGICPLLDLPARLYVRYLYHPLVMRRFRRRGW